MAMIEEVAQEAADWAAGLYMDRTRAVAAGTVNPYYVHPAYRVDRTEIVMQFPQLQGPDGWEVFQPYFDEAIKKRKLLKVLHGKMTAEEWVAKHPQGELKWPSASGESVQGETMTDLRRGDLVITDDHYYGIVLELTADFAVVFCSNGLRADYTYEGLTWVPLHTNEESSNSAHANFAEILRRE